MNLAGRIHAMHRIWRYRLRTERNEIAFLLSRDLAGGTLVDVGAHKGAWVHWMSRKAGPGGRVVAFEPQPELFDYLGALKKALRWGNVDLEPLALSSEEGSATLSRTRHWGGASLESLGEEARADEIETFSVGLTTLDRYLAGHPELPPVRFIKIDVQDHELAVLQGASGVLREAGPALLFECCDHVWNRGEVDAFLREQGYEGRFFHRGDLVPVERLPGLRASIPAPYLNFAYLPSDAWGAPSGKSA